MFVTDYLYNCNVPVVLTCSSFPRRGPTAFTRVLLSVYNTRPKSLLKQHYKFTTRASADNICCNQMPAKLRVGIAHGQLGDSAAFGAVLLDDGRYML